MTSPAPSVQDILAMRRQGYGALAGGSALIHAVLAVAALPGTAAPPAVGALLSAGLLLAALSGRVSLRVLDAALLWTVNLGALYFAWDFAVHDRTLGATEILIPAIFLAVWASLLPLGAALLRSGLVTLALLLAAPPHTGHDLAPFLYLGLLGVLIAQLSVSGRQIQRQLSRTAHYASLALTDPLTGLPNRRFLEGRLHDRFAAPGTALGVLLIDLDHFKTINDRYGHAVGDRVLRRVGALLRSGARPGDLVARWGGEEFVVLVETGERAVLEQLCARLRRALQEVGAGEGLPPVTVSVGAALSQEASDVPGLLRLADRRLYRAKRAGRDRLNMDDLSPHATLISLRPQA